MKHINREVPFIALAYIGGIYEHSGDVRVEHRRTTKGNICAVVRVSVRHKDRRCLDFIVEAFRVGSVGLLCKGRAMYRLQICGQNGLHMLEMIRPFVIAKRAQIDAAVRAYWDSKQSFRDDRRAQ